MVSDYIYVSARIGRDGLSSITWEEICANSMIDVDTGYKYILAGDIKSVSHTPLTESFKLRWRNLTDSPAGPFVDLVTGSGELRAATSQGCITNGDPVADPSGCADATVGDSEEVEDESPLQTGNLNCGTKDYNIETQWCILFQYALAGKEYQFQLYSVTADDVIAIGPTMKTASAGWAGVVNDVTNPNRVNSINKANIAKVNGVATA